LSKFFSGIWRDGLSSFSQNSGYQNIFLRRRFGLDASNVVIESEPIIFSENKEMKLEREI
jgi:hypothetical protein